MKILIGNDSRSAHYFIRLGLSRAFTYCGHEVVIWDMQSKPALDIFSEFEPDLFIGQTFNLTRPIFKAILERPWLKVAMKAADWGSFNKTLDNEKFPILLATEEEKENIRRLKDECGKPDFVYIHYHPDYVKDTHGYWEDELGVKVVPLMSGADIFEYTCGNIRHEFKCDLGFVGGRWGYKAQSIDKFLVPLCQPNSGFRVKIFGNSNWGIPNYCGYLPDEYTKDFFASSTILPNISEPHSQVFGFDIVERPFKCAAAGRPVVSDYVEGLTKLYTPDEEMVFAKTPQEFEAKCRSLLNNEKLREKIAKAGQTKTLSEHTYFHRIKLILDELGLDSTNVLPTYNSIRKELGI